MSGRSVVIAGDFGAGDGGAPFARVSQIALGLAGAGCAVHVFGLSGRRKGATYGLVTEPIFGRDSIALYGWKGGKMGRLSRLRWFWNTYQSSAQVTGAIASEIDQRTVLILYGRSYRRLMPLANIAKKCGATLVWDTTEGIERFRGRGGKCSPIYIDWWLGTRALARSADLVTAITNSLADRYASVCRRVMVLPVLGEWSRCVQSEARRSSSAFRLIVFGALREKDAPQTVLDSVSLLSARKVNLEIHLVGRYNDDRTSRGFAARLLALSNATTSIVGQGAMAKGDMISLFETADCFMLLRPDTPAERLAFPTRIVEILMYGKPLITSDVGDVSRYLQNGRDAIVIQNDPRLVAESVAGLVGEPGKAAAIGITGRERAAKCFDRHRMARELLARIREIRSDDGAPS